VTEPFNPRLIAYYLPQYHPIPENDAWWGNGFTEWTNVAKAKPLFHGHHQPHLPADLGFYDLRVPEVREAQASLAREAGIEGFCYWHYWFGGKRLLERPFTEVLSSDKPDFPFCLAWANDSWTGAWYGAPDHILQKQTYPGKDDHSAHFKALLPAFQDHRYMQVDGKPLFFLFQPSAFCAQDIELWKTMALSAGLNGLYLTGIVKNDEEAARIARNGFDACTISRTAGRGKRLPRLQRSLAALMGEKRAASLYQRVLHRPFYVFKSRDLLPYIDLQKETSLDFFPAVMPNWDNTPRAGVNGHIFAGTSPAIFREHLHQALLRVKPNPAGKQIVILKSWNEWAEGNYLEPDQEFGLGYLDAIREELSSWNNGIRS